MMPVKSIKPPNDLLRLRAQAGLSRRELSERCGISVSAIFSAENGSHKIRLSTERAIREALSCAIARPAGANPPFSMRCRWCGERIASIKFDPASCQMIIVDKKYGALNGWFYHDRCLKQKTDVEINNPDTEIE